MTDLTTTAPRPLLTEEAAQIAEAMGYARGIRGEETDEADLIVVAAPDED